MHRSTGKTQPKRHCFFQLQVKPELWHTSCCASSSESAYQNAANLLTPHNDRAIYVFLKNSLPTLHRDCTHWLGCAIPKAVAKETRDIQYDHKIYFYFFKKFFINRTYVIRTARLHLPKIEPR